MSTHYDWGSLYAALAECRACPLAQGRTHAVIGTGNPHGKIMLVGEGPGRDEDATGVPFVGRAGQLLDKMLAAIDLDREQVYIANVVKCRPPNNRTPLPEEAEACLPYLRAQFALVRPAIILCLGATAARYLCSPDIRISRDRGQWVEKKGVWILPTYHPAALLRNADWKRDAWEDMKKLRAKAQELGLYT